MKKACFLLLLLSSCATVPYSGVNKWQKEPSFVIDASMPKECITASLKGLELYSDNGIELKPVFKPFDWIGFIVLETGTITVQHYGLKGTAAGETLRIEQTGEILEKDGRRFKFLRSAGIVLDECSPLVAAHEIGHALGLEHSKDTENVMYPEAIGKLELTEGQVEWIRWE